MISHKRDAYKLYAGENKCQKRKFVMADMSKVMQNKEVTARFRAGSLLCK